MYMKKAAQPGPKTSTPSSPEHARQLTALEQLYQTLDAWFDAAVITDPAGIILQANTACSGLLGWRTGELIGKDAACLYVSPGRYTCTTGETLDIHENHMQQVQHARQALLANGHAALTDAYCVTRQGLAVPVEQKSTLLRKAAGDFSGILTVICDRSVEYALRSAEARFHTFFEYAPDAIYISDVNGIFIDGNRSAEQLTGYRRAELIGKNYFDLELLTPEQFPQALELLERNINGSPTGPDEFRLQRRDGRLITVEICTYPLFIQGERCVLGVAHDITQRKQAEIELNKARKSLENKVRERTQDLEEANTALRVLLKGRDEDRAALEESMLHNLHELVLPCIEKLKGGKLQDRQRATLELLETNLRDITSPMMRSLSMQHLRFTPAEISVATCVRHGRNTREIADLLQLSIKTVHFHRENIRRKCGIKNKKVNLRTFLASLA